MNEIDVGPFKLQLNLRDYSFTPTWNSIKLIHPTNLVGNDLGGSHPFFL